MIRNVPILLVCGVCVYGSSALTGIRQTGDAVADVAKVTAWQTALERQQALLADNRNAIDAATAVLRQRLADVQARLVELDAEAAALVASVGLDSEAIGGDLAHDGRPSPALLATTSGPGLAALLEAASDELDRRERQLGVLDALLDNYALAPRGRPVAAGRISSRYGERTDPLTGDPAYHKGIDIAGKVGEPVVVVADGLVTWSGPRSGYGQTIDVAHGHDLVTRYAHNAENLVEVGDIVQRGDIIARLGASGRTTGPNLHFEVLHARRQVDPIDYME